MKNWGSIDKKSLKNSATLWTDLRERWLTSACYGVCVSVCVSVCVCVGLRGSSCALCAARRSHSSAAQRRRARQSPVGGGGASVAPRPRRLHRVAPRRHAPLQTYVANTN